MITYSYKSFSKEDIKDINIWSPEEIEKFDNVKLDHLTSVQKGLITRHYDDMYYDVWQTTGEMIPAIFKQIAVYDKIKHNPKVEDLNAVFTYSLSDRESTDGEDERVLECGVFNHKDDDTYEFILTFKIKLQHVLSARDNFRKDINNIRMLLAKGNESDSINTYVIPIYIYAETDNNDKPKYVRFSNFVKNNDLIRIHTLLEIILWSLNRYITVNTFTWFNLNNRTTYYVSTNLKAPYSSPKKAINRQNFTRMVRSNKNLVIRLDTPHNICLVMNTTRKNMYSGTSGKLCSLSSYKFQVIGHYQHYWVGKGRKTRIKKWIDPYFKNDDYQFNVVKEYYQKNAPEA